MKCDRKIMKEMKETYHKFINKLFYKCNVFLSTKKLQNIEDLKFIIKIEFNFNNFMEIKFYRKKQS